MSKSKHKFQNRIYSLLSGRAVLVHPNLRKITGSINGALWLSQVLYWYDKGDVPDFIRKSRFDITRETGLSRDQQIRVEKELKLRGIVKIVVKPGRPSPINHITLDMNKLEKLANNLRGISTLENDRNISLTSDFTVNQFTHSNEYISENTQKSTHNKEPPENFGPGYKSFIKARDALIKKKII